MTGTTIAQAIPIAISPILTRIYAPEDFGLVALYLAIFSILAAIATGKYELAIMAPSSDSEAKNILILSILTAALISLITIVPIWIFNHEISILLKNQEIRNWLYFIPFSMFFFGVYQSIDYWLNRQKKYKAMVENKLIKASSVPFAQLLVSIISKSGLIIGNIIGLFVSMVIVIKRCKFVFADFRSIEYKKLIIKYKEYPLYQAPSSIVNAMAAQAPIFFMTQFFSFTTVGFFSVVINTLNIPVALISKSIGQVYFQEISKHANLAPQLLLNDISRVALKLLVLSILSFTLIGFFGAQLFSIIYGHNWLQAGYYAQILVISISIKFIISPLSTIFLAIGRIKIALLWQLIYFFVIISVLFTARDFKIETFLWVYVASEVILYLFYFFLMIHETRKFIATSQYRK